MQPEKWDERFLLLAQFIGQWSKDPSTQCGAVIVRPDRTIASMGFNGFPRHVPDEYLADREYKLHRVIHAEMNALLFLREPARGYTLYTSPFPPCCRCAAHIVQSGIDRVVSIGEAPERWEESLQITRQIFAQASVALEEWKKT